MTARDYMTVKDLMAYLSISRDTVHRLMKVYGLPYVKLEKKVLFRKADVDSFLEAHLIKKKPPN
jgi:excisionase family DNA binding protein